MNFSERYGYKKVRDSIQLESMDEPLRNGLWNALQIFVWDDIAKDLRGSGAYLPGSKHGNSLFQLLWIKHFKRTLDSLDTNWYEALGKTRDYFFKCEWHEAYSFIEFVANHYDRYDFKLSFVETCNNILEGEMAGWRFVGDKITKITDKNEIAEIDEAIEQNKGPVETHLDKALEHLSDRQSPDYRNSIKESISAVESLVQLTLGEKGTLGKLIKRMDEKIKIHQAMKDAFDKLYGYTSNEGGIRHAMLEPEKITFEDAKFMLVTCSAFINFVKSRLAS